MSGYGADALDEVPRGADCGPLGAIDSEGTNPSRTVQPQPLESASLKEACTAWRRFAVSV